ANFTDGGDDSPSLGPNRQLQRTKSSSRFRLGSLDRGSLLRLFGRDRSQRRRTDSISDKREGRRGSGRMQTNARDENAEVVKRKSGLAATLAVTPGSSGRVSNSNVSSNVSSASSSERMQRANVDVMPIAYTQSERRATNPSSFDD